MSGMKIKNPLFNAHQLYVMLRLSAIEYFPYESRELYADEILSIYMHKNMGVKFTVENKASERELLFSGETYERYKDIVLDGEKKLYGNERSPVWYIMKIREWHKDNIGYLNGDLSAMRSWLEDNDYLKNGRPTDKFLREQYLGIATDKIG